MAALYAEIEPFKRIEQSLEDNEKRAFNNNSKQKIKKIDRSLSPEYRGRACSANRVNMMTKKRNLSPSPSYDRKEEGYTPLPSSVKHI